MENHPMSDAAADAPDLLYGADAIASFLGVTRPTVYHLNETRRIPFFKVGKTTCARRSTLLAALERLEQLEVA
jgi:excisionase family DNA binding protein